LEKTLSLVMSPVASDRVSRSLQRTATHCNTLQHTATHRNTAIYVAASTRTTTHCHVLQLACTAANCNSLLQHTATYFNLNAQLQTATLRGDVLLHTAKKRVCNVSSHCNALPRTATCIHCYKLQHTATYCNLNALLQTATQCNRRVYNISSQPRLFCRLVDIFLTATHFHILQHTATDASIMSRRSRNSLVEDTYFLDCNTLPATCCNTRPHPAANCNTLQQTRL